jgi:hypothetical protein
MPDDGQVFNGFAWNAEADAWVVARLDGTAAVSPGGGSVDFDTTPVAAIGSDVEQTIPNWLAGAPIIEIPDDILIAPHHRGAWIYMMNDIGSIILLPDDWLPGQSFGARQIGTGPVSWQLDGGATMQLPATKLEHSGISEQYEDIILRVIANVGGHAAVWGVSGATV